MSVRSEPKCCTSLNDDCRASGVDVWWFLSKDHICQTSPIYLLRPAQTCSPIANSDKHEMVTLDPEVIRWCWANFVLSLVKLADQMAGDAYSAGNIIIGLDGIHHLGVASQH